jgi:hypothetical protein
MTQTQLAQPRLTNGRMTQTQLAQPRQTNGRMLKPRDASWMSGPNSTLLALMRCGGAALTHKSHFFTELMKACRPQRSQNQPPLTGTALVGLSGALQLSHTKHALWNGRAP